MAGRQNDRDEGAQDRHDDQHAQQRSPGDDGAQRRRQRREDPRIHEGDNCEHAHDETGEHSRRNHVEREHYTLPGRDVAAHRGGGANRIEGVEVRAHIRGRQCHHEGNRRRGRDDGDQCGNVGQDQRSHRRGDHLGGCAGDLARNRRLEGGGAHRVHRLLDAEELAERHGAQAEGFGGLRGQHHDVDTREWRGREGHRPLHEGVRQIIIGGTGSLGGSDRRHIETAQVGLAGTVNQLRIGHEDATGVQGGDRADHVVLVEVSGLAQVGAVIDDVGDVDLRHRTHVVAHRERRLVGGVDGLDHGLRATRATVPRHAVHDGAGGDRALRVDDLLGQLKQVASARHRVGLIDRREEDLPALSRVRARVPARLVRRGQGDEQAASDEHGRQDRGHGGERAVAVAHGVAQRQAHAH